MSGCACIANVLLTWLAALVVAAGGGPQETPPAPEPSDVRPLAAPAADLGDVDVRVVAPDGEVEVGEPFELTIVCEHGVETEVRASARVLDEVLAHDTGWHVFEVRARPDVPVGATELRPWGFEADQRLVSTVVYRLAALSLEPRPNEETGGLAWSPLRRIEGLGVDVRLPSGDGLGGATDADAGAGAASNDVAPPSAASFAFVAARAPQGGVGVRVRSLLDAEEARPRPLPDPLRPARSDTAAAWSRAAWIGGGAFAVFAIALVVAWRGSRVADEPAPAPTRTERLEDLRERIARGDQDLREAAFALVAEVRASLAERGVTNDRAWTEEQWRAALDESRLVRGEREDLDRFLARAQAVRYAPERPTRWALEDLVRAALEIEASTSASASNGDAADGARASAATAGGVA